MRVVKTKIPPSNERFSRIGRYKSGCVYVVELTNGHIKAGMSRNPIHRMRCLSETFRGSAVDISRFHLGPDLIKRSPAAAESLLLSSLAAVASIVSGREVFRGIEFEKAVGLVESVSAQVMASKPSPRRRKIAEAA